MELQYHNYILTAYINDEVRERIRPITGEAYTRVRDMRPDNWRFDLLTLLRARIEATLQCVNVDEFMRFSDASITSS